MNLLEIIKIKQKLVMSNKKSVDLKAIPGVGIFCAIISVLFWSSAGLCIKLSTDVHALEMLTVSALIQTAIYFIVMLNTKTVVNYFGEPNERIYLFLRCTLGTISMACLYTSYRLIPLSDATTMRFTAPVFVSLFAYILLRERFGPMEMSGALITITGVVLVARPTFLFSTGAVVSADTCWGLVLAMSAAITIAISMTVMRRLQRTQASVVIFWFSLETVCLGLVALWLLDEFKWPSNATVWLVMCITGMCGASDQLFITMALKLENAAPVAVVRALSVVISFIFSVTILDEPILLTSFLGGSLIFISIICTGIYKWYIDYNNKPNHHNNNNTIAINNKTVANCPHPPPLTTKSTNTVYIIEPVDDPSDPYLLKYLEFRHME
ncbi:solute carrier family 35 member G1-like, partial [Oppia nitens]|uniref:solute carrier family 35 member G1-like n=1 Tax=Oppia nitens TaxID=1686743 RepID=UPI0023DB1153